MYINDIIIIAKPLIYQEKRKEVILMSNLFSLIDKTAVNKVVEIQTDMITPNPHQPRKNFDAEALDQLAASIKCNGILQPLTVRKIEFGYELIAGERRLRAAKLLNMKTVPCIIMNISERNSAVMALVENIQRKDLSFFDEAYAIEKLIDFYGMTQEDAAIKLGKSQSTIANKLRLLKLTEPERRQIVELNLTERHARALLKLQSQEERLDVIEKIRKYNFNVEQTEKYINNMIVKENERASLKRRSGAFKNVKLFVNTINHAIEMMRAAGINADSKKTQDENFIEYVIRIPI